MSVCMAQELRSIYGFSSRVKGWKSLDLANIFTVIKKVAARRMLMIERRRKKTQNRKCELNVS